MTISNKYTGSHDFSEATIAGIAGITQFDASVGATGADYTTLKAAIDAGFTRIVVIDDTTEAADIAVPSGGLYIYIVHGATLAMADYQFTYAAAANVKLRGEGTISRTLTAHSSRLFANSSYTASVVDVDGLTFTLTGAYNGCYLADEIQIVRNAKFNLPDAFNNGINLSYINGETKCLIDNVWFVGGGSSCYNAISTVGSSGSSSPVSISNIYFTGNWSAPGFSTSMVNIANATVTNVTVDVTTGDVSLYFQAVAGSNISRPMDNPSRKVNLYMGGSNSERADTISNAYLVNGSVFIDGADYVLLNNITSQAGIIDIDAGVGPGNNNKISNCNFAGKSTIGGADNIISNCELGGLQFLATSDGHKANNCLIAGTGLYSSGDNHLMSNCTIDSNVVIAGNSTTLNGCTINGTLTIAAAASGTLIMGCRYDAINDSGTDTTNTSSIEF